MVRRTVYQNTIVANQITYHARQSLSYIVSSVSFHIGEGLVQ